jgi:hypothetical protein
MLRTRKNIHWGVFRLDIEDKSGNKRVESFEREKDKNRGKEGKERKRRNFECART